MSYALARGTRWEPAPVDADRWREWHARLAREFEATFGRAPIGPQLDGITATWLWLRGAIAVEKANGGDGTRLQRSMTQMIRGVAKDLDWHLEPSVKANRQRYGNQVRNRLNYLLEMGYVEDWEAITTPDGEGVGILLAVPAGVAQSVIPTHRLRRSRRAGQVVASARQIARRGLAERRNLRGSAGFSPPFGDTSLGSKSSNVNFPPQGRARARAYARGAAPTGQSDAIERACTPELRPALRRLRTALRGGEHPMRVLSESCQGGVSPVVVALACWDLATNGREPRLSLGWRGQLERSAEQYDRLNGPGRASWWLAERLDLIWQDELTDGRLVNSLAYYAHALKQRARSARRAQRRAGKPRPWRSQRPEASSW